MNDYFRCAEYNRTLNINRKSLTVKLFANRSEISFKRSRPRDVLVVKIALWNTTETRIVA